VEPSGRRIRVVVADVVVADTTRALRVVETSHPPVYYFPPQDVRSECLRQNRRRSYCEFKGEASYYDLVVGDREVRDGGWYYPRPSAGYAALRDFVAFYPGRVDAAFVDDEQVRAQPGDFYGGWITADIQGPFKGGPGTAGW